MIQTPHPRRWHILAIGVLAQMTFSTVFAGIPVAGLLLRTSYHLSTARLGLILGCMGLGVALSEILWGQLTDRLGDKIVLVTGLGGMGTAMGLIALLAPPSLPHPDDRVLGGLLVLAGLLGGSINAASGRAVMHWFGPAERGFAMSIRQTAIPVGGALGSLLVPFAASHAGFATAFGLLAAQSLLCMLAVAAGLVDVPHAASTTRDPNPLGRRDAWHIAIAAALLTVPQMAVLTFGGIYLADTLHLGLARTTFILIAIQLLGGLLRIVLGKLSDRHGSRRPLLRLTAVSAGSMALLLAWPGHAEATGILLLGLAGLAGHAWHGIAYTEMAVMAGLSRVGSALGMIGMTIFTAACLTPWMIPGILHAAGWQGVWLTVGLLSLLAFPLIAREAPAMAAR